MSYVCRRCGYRQHDYEAPVVNGKIQCRNCREVIITIVKRPSTKLAAHTKSASIGARKSDRD